MMNPELVPNPNAPVSPPLSVPGAGCHPIPLFTAFPEYCPPESAVGPRIS